MQSPSDIKVCLRELLRCIKLTLIIESTLKHGHFPVPKLCVRAKPITTSERECAFINFVPGSQITCSTEPFPSSTIPSMHFHVSVFHMLIEYRITKVIKQILALMRKVDIYPRRAQLEMDRYTKQKIARSKWREAEIPFPYTSGGVNYNVPFSILQYARIRLKFLIYHVEESSTSLYQEAKSWCKTLDFLVEHALYLLIVSLDLEIHEIIRLKWKESAFAGSKVKTLRSKVNDLIKRLYGTLERKEANILTLLEDLFDQLSVPVSIRFKAANYSKLLDKLFRTSLALEM